MTNFEYELLRRIRDERVSAEQQFTIEENDTLQEFQSNRRGWVRITRTLYFEITPRGRIALQEHEEMLRQQAEEEAKNKREKAADRRRGCLNLLFELIKDVLILLLGVAIERGWNVSDLVAWLFK